jgi:hypothetical protein
MNFDNRNRAAYSIPSELTDNIIHQLWDDKPFLALCGLVCRSWVPASRSHLFSDISLNAENIIQFIRLSGSPHATMARHVRFLEYHVMQQHVPWRYIELLPSFPALEKLILALVPITSLDLNQSCLHKKFRTATHLAFFGCTLDSIDQFNTLLLGFPFVRYLDLSTFYIYCPPLQAMPQGLQLPLCSFGIEDLGFCRVMSWLSHDSIPKLRTLRLGSNIVENIDPDHVSAMLKSLGSYLPHLHINVDTQMTSSCTS